MRGAAAVGVTLACDLGAMYGEEEFLRMARRKALQMDELLKDLPRDFALQTLRGKAFTPARLTEFYEMAFGSPYKVIVLLEGESSS